MAISGYLTFGHIRRPIEQWLNRKALALLVPFLSWMVIYYWVPDQFLKKGDNFVDFVWITVRNPGNGLWYLPVLFVFYALAALVEEGPIGDWGLLVVGIIISAFTVSPIVGVDQMQLVWWWFAIGYLFAKHQEKLMKWRNYGWAAGVIAYPVSLYMVEHFKDLAYLPVLKLAGIIVSTLLVYGIVKVGAGRPFAYLGVHSLEIYAAQFVFTSLAIGSGVLRIPIVTVITIAGSLALGALFRLNPYTDMLFLGGRYRRPTTPEVPASEAS
jgi:fucose 4-O-acetylase-like acetyltransferase